MTDISATAVGSGMLDARRYLTVLQTEAAALLSAARASAEQTGGLDAEVPTCPGWSVRDALMHVGQVYLHKVECMRQQAQPDPWPPQWDVAEPITWVAAALDTLVDELVQRGPAAPSYTWWPQDQTVGFWYRRMAQETAVHRVDLQSAVGAVAPVEDDVAVDGVDEILGVMFAGDWSDWDEPGDPPGRGTVAIRTGDQAWRVTLTPESVEVDRGPGPVDVTVTGEPSEVLLWLWGRRPESAVRVEGDAQVLEGFRDRLNVVLQ